MKSVNPVYLLGAAIFILLSVFIDTAVTKSTLREKVVENAILQTEIEEIQELKKEFSDPKKNKREFLRVISNPSVEKYVKSKDVKENKATVFISGIDEKESKWFIQKLFNESFRIKECEIKKSDEYSLDIKAEVLF